MRTVKALPIMHKPSKVVSAFLLACLLTLPQIAAQNATPAPAKKALFWKASSANNVVYLLGSIHLGSKSMYPLPHEIEDAFEKSTALVVEVDINHVDKEKLQALILETGLYPDDDLLWNHVSKETRANLEEFCSTYGVPAQLFAKMKPWMVSVAAGEIAMAKMGMDPELGIDKYFLDKAGKTKDQKRVVEIESAEWQIKLLSGFADDVQGTLLASAMEDMAKLPEKMKQVREAWLSGDADTVDKLLSESSRVPEHVKKAMLADRNLHMADVADQFLKGKEQVFVVVGAAHFVGKDGVVAILKNRGYKLEQVSLK